MSAFRDILAHIRSNATPRPGRERLSAPALHTQLLLVLTFASPSPFLYLIADGFQISDHEENRLTDVAKTY